MKVFLESKDESGEAALKKVLSLWTGRERFRLLRIMGNRVHFAKVADTPLKIQYSQIDFNNLPTSDEYCLRVKLNIFASFAMYGVNDKNTVVTVE